MRLGILIVAALLLAGCDGPHRLTVPSGAMEPTIKTDETITYTPATSARAGDIVVLKDPWGSGTQVKRLVATEGQVIGCCDDQGRVTVDGKPLDEPYVQEDSPVDRPVSDRCASRRFGPVTVEKGALFVLGDHRLISQDSRCQGTVRASSVIGVVER